MRAAAALESAREVDSPPGGEELGTMCTYGDVAFVVDEKYQGLGIATYLYEMLIRLAKERGLKGFTAEVLQANKEMMKVFEKGHLPINARVQNGIYQLTIPFDTKNSQTNSDKKLAE